MQYAVICCTFWQMYYVTTFHSNIWLTVDMLFWSQSYDHSIIFELQITKHILQDTYPENQNCVWLFRESPFKFLEYFVLFCWQSLFSCFKHNTHLVEQDKVHVWYFFMTRQNYWSEIVFLPCVCNAQKRCLIITWS